MVSGPVPTELFLEVLFLKKHQVTVRRVVPGAMFLQDVRQVTERWVVYFPQEITVQVINFNINIIFF